MDELRAAAERHPLDYYVYAQASQQLARTGNRVEAIKLLNHALRLHPTHPGLHRIPRRGSCSATATVRRPGSSMPRRSGSAVRPSSSSRRS